MSSAIHRTLKRCVPVVYLSCLVGLLQTASAGRVMALRPEVYDALIKPAFSLTPRELLELNADQAPPGLDAVVLCEQTRLRFDRRKRLIREHHAIFRVNNSRALTSHEWSTVSAQYSPWIEHRPTIRARVVTPGGKAIELDPARLVESAVPSSEPRIFSDNRVLAAPLPGLQPGAVVEQLIVVEEEAPRFDVGNLYRVIFGHWRFAALQRLILEFPEQVKVHSRTRGGVPPPKLEKHADSQRVVYSLVDHEQPPLDPRVRVVPLVDVSTADSWQAVARSYAKDVETTLSSFDAGKVLERIVADGDDRATKLRKILAFVRSKVRYLGLEFGQRAYYPAPPAEVLSRLYGDCKDQSTLLVGLLRAAGFEANLALLRAGLDIDVYPDLAGFGLFNHVIVHIAGSPDVWIDPVAPYASPNVLPYQDQARRALVVSAGTEDLVPTPRTPLDASARETEIRIDFLQAGPAHVKEIARASGALISVVREDWDKTSEQLAEAMRPDVERVYGARTFQASCTVHDDPSTHLERIVDVPQAKAYQATEQGGSVSLGFAPLFDYLPGRVLDAPNAERVPEERDEALAARKKGFMELRGSAMRVPVAHRYLIRYVLNAPAGYHWTGAVAPLEGSAFGFRVSRRVALNGSQATVSAELEVRAEGVQPETLDVVRQMFFDFRRDMSIDMRFVRDADAAR
ncbi:MAG: DUF3857 and transglutaminase domain-containing protein [Myxococcales bacterium]